MEGEQKLRREEEIRKIRSEIKRLETEYESLSELLYNSTNKDTPELRETIDKFRRIYTQINSEVERLMELMNQK